MASTDEWPSLFTDRKNAWKIARSVTSIVIVLLSGYAILRGRDAMMFFLEVTINQGVSSTDFQLLGILVTQAPLFAILLVSLAGIGAYRNGGIVVSSLLPPALLLGMGFAIFGFPPKLRNVVEPSIPIGLIFGVVGWLLGRAGRHAFKSQDSQ